MLAFQISLANIPIKSFFRPKQECNKDMSLLVQTMLNLCQFFSNINDQNLRKFKIEENSSIFVFLWQKKLIENLLQPNFSI